MKKAELLEEFAKQLDYWKKESTACSTDSKSDLTWSENASAFKTLQSLVKKGNIEASQLEAIFEEVLRGFAVSLFTVIDGGTKLAELERVALVTEKGESIGEIHDEFVMHLVKSGRLK